MKVEDVLIELKQKSRLCEEEWVQIEKSFGEIIYLKIIKMLGGELSEIQQKQFVETLKTVQENQNQRTVSDMLTQLGFDKSKATLYLETAVKQSLVEIVEILNDRLSTINKKDILELIG